jgi:hypothetical protein
MIEIVYQLLLERTEEKHDRSHNFRSLTNSVLKLIFRISWLHKDSKYKVVPVLNLLSTTP